MNGQSIGMGIFVACLLHSWLVVSVRLWTHDELLYTHGVRAKTLRKKLLRSPKHLFLTALYLPALVAFAAGWNRLAAAVALFVLAGLGRQLVRVAWQKSGNTVDRLGLYVPAAVSLFGWILVRLLTWHLSPEASEKLAWSGACGVLAGIYTLGGLAKYFEGGGFSWISTRNMSLLVAERSWAENSRVARMRRAAIAIPGLMFAGAAYGFAVEVLAILFVIPALRWPIAIAAAALQVSIILLMGYVELEWIALPFALLLLAGG